MTENKPRRLSELVSPFAPEGANDNRWFLVEHQLMQAKISVRSAAEILAEIGGQPENTQEHSEAKDCLDIVKGMYVDLLKHYTTFLSYLSDTDVPERIARKEL